MKTIEHIAKRIGAWLGTSGFRGRQNPQKQKKKPKKLEYSRKFLEFQNQGRASHMKFRNRLF